METKGASKDGRVGVSINKEVADELLTIKNELFEKLGVNLSFTQVIEYLVKQYKTRQNDQ
jgi:hypothetical protein